MRRRCRPSSPPSRVTPQAVSSRAAIRTMANIGRVCLVFTSFPSHVSCDAQQYWYPAVMWVTHEYAKDVLVVVKLLRSPARGFRSLAGQFLVFQLLVVAIVLIAVAAVSVAQSTREFREVRGQRMIAVAENLASTPIVRDRYADPFASRVLAPDLDRA